MAQLSIYLSMRIDACAVVLQMCIVSNAQQEENSSLVCLYLLVQMYLLLTFRSQYPMKLLPY